MRIKIGVIFGGETVEHEVSIISALQAIKALNQKKYEIIPIYISKNKIWYTGNYLFDIKNFQNTSKLLKKLKPVTLIKQNNDFYLQNTKGLFKRNITAIDIILPIVHGNNIEDGSLAGYLATIGIPYAFSNVLASALGQDKVIMKQVLQNNNILVPDYVWFFDTEYLENQEQILKNIKKLKYPVIVKPATLGSSIGISYVKNETEIDEAINNAIIYDRKIIVEKVVENLIEVNASVLGNYEYQKVSVLEEVMGVDEILSYKDKYESSTKLKGMESTSRVIPARISKELTNNIINTSKEVFKILNLSGICRIDYLIDSKKELCYVNESNTIPGSLAFYLWQESNLPYPKLLEEIITIAIKEYKNQKKKIVSFDNNILANFNGTKGLKK